MKKELLVVVAILLALIVIAQLAEGDGGDLNHDPDCYSTGQDARSPGGGC